MTLGEKISELRKLKHYSQEDLAKAMNVSRQTISKWETNLSLPDIERIQQLSSIFDVTLNELLQVDEKKNIDQNELQALINQMLVIQDKYNQDLDSRKHQQKIILVVGTILFICLCFIIVLLFQQIKDTKQQMNMIASEVYNGINSINLSIQNILDQKDSLISDFSYHIESVDFKNQKIQFTLKTSLKEGTDQTQVQFVLVDKDNKQYSLPTVYQDGMYVFHDFIPLINIQKLSIIIMNDNQKKTQVINDFVLNIKDAGIFKHTMTVNYSMVPVDNNYNRGYKIGRITFRQDFNHEDSLRETLDGMNMQNSEQVEHVSIIPNDTFYIQKIEYKIIYEDKEIKKGTLVNQQKSKLFEPSVDLSLPIGHLDQIKVEANVYTYDNQSYYIYNHSTSNTIGLIQMVTNDSQEILEHMAID